MVGGGGGDMEDLDIRVTTGGGGGVAGNSVTGTASLPATTPAEALLLGEGGDRV